jgi:hypothetical protein
MGNASSTRPRPDLQSLSEVERHLLQRLGAALVTEWNDLPTPLQRTLFDRAVVKDPTSDTDLLKARMARFLHDHKDAPGSS